MNEWNSLKEKVESIMKGSRSPEEKIREMISLKFDGDEQIALLFNRIMALAPALGDFEQREKNLISSKLTILSNMNAALSLDSLSEEKKEDLKSQKAQMIEEIVEITCTKKSKVNPQKIDKKATEFQNTDFQAETRKRPQDIDLTVHDVNYNIKEEPEHLLISGEGRTDNINALHWSKRRIPVNDDAYVRINEARNKLKEYQEEARRLEEYSRRLEEYLYEIKQAEEAFKSDIARLEKRRDKELKTASEEINRKYEMEIQNRQEAFYALCREYHPTIMETHLNGINLTAPLEVYKEPLTYEDKRKDTTIEKHSGPKL